MSGKKFFVYTRVSVDEYEKSIDNQIDIIRKLAEKD
jgi:DNA invertase Pin-like site-specific DNA recombinase